MEQRIGPDDLPTSLRYEGSEAAQAANTIDQMPGVATVDFPDTMCSAVFELLAKGSTEHEVALELIERRWGKDT